VPVLIAFVTADRSRGGEGREVIAKTRDHMLAVGDKVYKAVWEGKKGGKGTLFYNILTTVRRKRKGGGLGTPSIKCAKRR